MNSKSKIIFWLSAFSIAMGFLETAIVIYLRKLYYPTGFNFPLVPIPFDIAGVELIREAATIIMLAGIGIVAGTNKLQRFAFFIYCFAIWDLFYYVFLKLFLDWPASLFTWDILFLIPMPWVGPVLAPCIVSISLIALACIIIYFQENPRFEIQKKEWLALLLGCLVIIFSFVQDYLNAVLFGSNENTWSLASKTPLFSDISTYIPEHYNWWIFWLGQSLICFAIMRILVRMKPARLSVA